MAEKSQQVPGGHHGPAASPFTPSAKITSSTIGSSTIYVDTVKAMAETVGVSNLTDEAAKELAEDITYRLKVIVQDALKFMDQGKRTTLSSQDMDASLKVKNIEPIYGFQAGDGLPFRFASGGGRELHFIEEKDQDMTEFLTVQFPKVPLEPSLRAHWMAIEGVMPAVPENPPLVSKDQQRVDSVDPSRKLKTGPSTQLPDSRLSPAVGKPIKFKTAEQVFIKQLATHELSVEQQLYYKEITEACVGSDENRRTEALGSLTNDPGLFELVPKLCTFISEGVRVNVVQFNLALLIYLMRMVKGLLENQTIYLERYLHELIPSVATCIVSKQLCTRPEADNHWALRDFAAKLMAQICKNFTTTTNNIQVRVTQIFCNALTQKVPLSSVYGAITGLGELGPDVIRVLIVPKVKDIGTKLEFCIEGVGHSQTDKTSAIKIKQLIVKLVAPVLKTTRDPPDILDAYTAEFGYLGPPLYTAVAALRSQELKQGAANPSPSSGGPAAVQRTLSAGGSQVIQGPNIIQRTYAQAGTAIQGQTTPVQKVVINQVKM